MGATRRARTHLVGHWCGRGLPWAELFELERIMSRARRTTANDETRVMIGMSWVFLVLGSIAMLFFVRDPSIVRHPQLALFSFTALIGCGVLRLLSRLLGARPEE